MIVPEAMLDKVAAAIQSAREDNTDPYGADYSNWAMTCAKAALMAIRIPTHEMMALVMSRDELERGRIPENLATRYIDAILQSNTEEGK